MDRSLGRYETEGSVVVCGHTLAGEDLKLPRPLRDEGPDVAASARRLA